MRLIVFCFLSFNFSLHANRCVENAEKDGQRMVNTMQGKVVGKRETAIDPRQNKPVSWTSFYVGIHQINAYNTLILLKGYPICPTSAW